MGEQGAADRRVLFFFTTAHAFVYIMAAANRKMFLVGTRIFSVLCFITILTYVEASTTVESTTASTNPTTTPLTSTTEATTTTEPTTTQAPTTTTTLPPTTTQPILTFDPSSIAANIGIYQFDLNPPVLEFNQF